MNAHESLCDRDGYKKRSELRKAEKSESLKEKMAERSELRDEKSEPLKEESKELGE